ncbi:MAG: hypothetical protein WBA57_21465 [Elainellaceae cyanobacterium]
MTHEPEQPGNYHAYPIRSAEPSGGSDTGYAQANQRPTANSTASSRPARSIEGDTETERPYFTSSKRERREWELEAIAELSEVLAFLVRQKFISAADFLDRLESFVHAFKEIHSYEQIQPGDARYPTRD